MRKSDCSHPANRFLAKRSFRCPRPFRLLAGATFLFSALGTGMGQASQPPSSPDPSASPGMAEGWESGGYKIHQSIEVGYRVNETTGSAEMYDTLLNLHSGPRLLDQSLSMQSTTHESLLFDNFFVNSFGWGGDPNNALRLRMEKNKWFDFRASFRRDQNFFDYNLLANPLNPSTSQPTIQVDSSPHNFATTRRMTDLDLTLLPQSWVSFRLGYSHNNMTGPSYSSVHEGTDALLFQPWNTTVNSYRLGADFKILPQTVLSYDQFLDYYKGDTTWSLASAAPALLPGGAGIVELGLPMDTVSGSPCRPTAPATTLIDASGTLTNLACNAFLSYNRSDRIRTSNPTERISLRSHYFDRLELTASFAYSDADMDAQFNEFFNGLTSRSFLRQSSVTGPPHARRISDVADFTATLHLTKSVRLIDVFRFWAFRIPENFAQSETDWVIPTSGSCTPPACSLLVPISATVPSTTTSLTSSSFNQNWKRNELDAVWDVNRHMGARIGFRYGSRSFTHVNDFSSDDVDYFGINEFTGLAGLWMKPINNLRFNFDLEHSNYDYNIVRIGPRKEGRYRIQANYTPKPWAILGGSINLLEDSNNDLLTNYDGHNRNYGVSASLAPRERFGVDFAYNFNDYQQNAMICFSDTPPAGVTLPVVTNAGSCTSNGYDDSSNPLLTKGYYTNKTHYAMGAVRFRPLPRITTEVGYSITSVNGSTPQFNILQPLGTLAYNYHLPLADVAVDIGHNLTWKAAWNYAQYGEKSFVGPTDPRYFHANNATFSLRWAF